MISACDDRYQEAANNAALAETLLANGNLVEARESAQRAIIARDDVADYFVLLARIELAAGQSNSAFNAFSRALDLRADSLEILQNVAELGLQTGRLVEAEEAANRILLLAPGAPRAMLVKGFIAIDNGKVDQARELVRAVLEQDPNDIGGVILSARISALEGQFGQALETLSKAREASGDDLALFVTALEVYRAQGNAAGMLTVFPAVVEAAGQVGDYQADFINFLYKTGDTVGARTQIAKVLVERPNDEIFLSTLRELLLEHDSAPFTPEQIASFSQTGTRALQLSLARFFFETRQYEVAQELLKRPLDENAAEGEGLQARILLAQGKAKQADELIARVIKRDVRNPDALLARSARNLAKRRVEAAIEDANIVVSDAPQEYAGYVALAKAQLAKGVEVRARQIYERGIRALPQSAKMAQAYEAFLRERGDEARIVSLYAGLAYARPSSVGAWEAFGKVCDEFNTPVCKRQVAQGLASARLRFYIDDAPGTPRRRGLFSRITPEQICQRTGGVCTAS